MQLLQGTHCPEGCPQLIHFYCLVFNKTQGRNYIVKKMFAVILIFISMLSTGCWSDQNARDPTAEKAFEITAEEAKASLDRGDKIIIVDVRTPAEYNEAHIKNAVLLPLDSIRDNAAAVIPDLEAVYFVYCRSGVRSETAAAQLVEMGYKNIYDLGGIKNWPYEKVSGQ